MIPGLGQPRVLRGNTRMMTTLRPALGTYFLNDETAHVHQWTGDGWESVGGSGAPEVSDLLNQLQEQASARSANPGSGSSPGIRRIPGDAHTPPGDPGDPSIGDPTIFVPPPAPDPLPKPGGMDVPSGGPGDPMGDGGTGYVPGIGAGIFETFERVRTGDWNRSPADVLIDSGDVTPSRLYFWSMGAPPALCSAGINNGSGYASFAVGGVGPVLGWQTSFPPTSPPGPWMDVSGYGLRFQVSISAVPGAGRYLTLYVSQQHAGPATFAELYATVSTDVALGKVTLFRNFAPPVVVAKNDWVAGTYNCRVEYRPNVVTRIKFWLVGTAEPGWLVSGVAPNSHVRYLGIGADAGIGLLTATTIRWDNMEFL